MSAKMASRKISSATILSVRPKPVPDGYQTIAGSAERIVKAPSRLEGAASASPQPVAMIKLLRRPARARKGELVMADDNLFEKGLKKRKQVLGEKYVDANLAGSDDFMMTFQRAVTELAWGYSWSRSGLDQKTRSILTL